jgi:mannose-1-phosphate guanylyltransferase
MTTSPLLIPHFYAVIPAGGVGSRLWPLSRADHPKFLHDLSGNGRTLLRNTWDRVQPLVAEGATMVVTGNAHVSSVTAQLPELGSSHLISEPSPKESAAAIGLAAAIIHARDPEAIVGSFPADHVISDDDSFRDAVTQAIAAAEQGALVTIGIRPTEPSSAFGYIQAGTPAGVPGADSAKNVVRFVEKPDYATAQTYVDSGEYLWNAGMFIAKAVVLMGLLEEQRPQLATGLREIAGAWDSDQRDEVMARVWPELEKVAIDYAVAEPAAEAGRMLVIPGEFGWDDVGDFAALARMHAKGPGDLAVLGENTMVLSDSSSGIVVSQSKRLVSLIGVDDIVIVDTPDALLVTTKKNAQRVKSVVDVLKINNQGDVL